MAAEANLKDLSLGEFQATGLKALRGAGYPWGVAEEGAAACRTLAEWGINPSASLLRLLTSVAGVVPDYWPDADLVTPSGMLCPFAAGSWLRDTAGTTDVERLELSGLVEPVLLSPALAILAEDGASYELTWPEGSIVAAAGGTGVEVHSAELATPVAATVVRVASPTQPATPGAAATRVLVAGDVLAQLERFAALTYAPNTEASRTKGAGEA